MNSLYFLLNVVYNCSKKIKSYTYTYIKIPDDILLTP